MYTWFWIVKLQSLLSSQLRQYNILLAPGSRKQIEKVTSFDQRYVCRLGFTMLAVTFCNEIDYKQNCSRLTAFNLTGLILATTNLQLDIENWLLIFSKKSGIRIFRIYS